MSGWVFVTVLGWEEEVSWFDAAYCSLLCVLIV